MGHGDKGGRGGGWGDNPGTLWLEGVRGSCANSDRGTPYAESADSAGLDLFSLDSANYSVSWVLWINLRGKHHCLQ